MEGTNPVEIDLCLDSFVAMSDGTKMEKPKFVKKSGKHIARWQRVVARRKKGSNRRETAKEMLSKKWEHTTNQSDDFAHKLSDKLVNSGYTSFAVEDLHIQDMVRNHRLAQSIHNASWNRFINMLSYKAESAGMKVIKVDPRDTTQECSNCHYIKKWTMRLALEDRTYRCNICGLTLDRDINASINILHKAATLGQRESHAQGDMASAIQQGSKSRIEELRTDKTYPLWDAVIA